MGTTEASVGDTAAAGKELNWSLFFDLACCSAEKIAQFLVQSSIENVHFIAELRGTAIYLNEDFSVIH